MISSKAVAVRVGDRLVDYLQSVTILLAGFALLLLGWPVGGGWLIALAVLGLVFL